jgi:hypothetical protein
VSNSNFSVCDDEFFERAEHVAGIGGTRNTYRISVGIPERKRPLWYPRRRLACEESVMEDTKETKRVYGLKQCISGSRLMTRSCKRGEEILSSSKGWDFLTSYRTISFSRMILV